MAVVLPFLMKVECSECGEELQVDFDTADRLRTKLAKLTVTPCVKCSDATKEEGDKEGYERGFAAGKAEAEKEG